MSSRVRQGEPPGRSRPRRIAKLNATPTSNERLNFRLTFLSFVYFGKRPRFSWPRKVSVVRREQIRVLNQNRTPASASALRTTFGRGICANCRGLSTASREVLQLPNFETAVPDAPQHLPSYLKPSKFVSFPSRRDLANAAFAEKRLHVVIRKAPFRNLPSTIADIENGIAAP